jgi:hypothetical protein
MIAPYSAFKLIWFMSTFLYGFNMKLKFWSKGCTWSYSSVSRERYKGTLAVYTRAATQKFLHILSSGVPSKCCTNFSQHKFYNCHDVTGRLHVSMFVWSRELRIMLVGTDRITETRWQSLVVGCEGKDINIHTYTHTHTPTGGVCSQCGFWPPFTTQNVQWYFKIVFPSILQ